MDAVQRAHEMMWIKMKDLPPVAYAYGQVLAKKVGLCAEVLLTAYAHYAQAVENLECSDEMYKIDITGIRFFEANKEPIELSVDDAIALVKPIPKEYEQYAIVIGDYEVFDIARPAIIVDTGEQGKFLISGIMRVNVAKEMGAKIIKVRIINLSKFITGV